ncbi:MAG TPA: zinc-dependent alcohol dehydrogenase family protein [Acidobacteriaceae bacterium]|nr:zinc-dependent alcohol dehydrogenase family protein [Acidobacteriaceae bacterium]
MPKIVRFYQTGGPEVLRVEEAPSEQPKANEVHIQVQAIGLNRAEALFRQGAYFEQPVLPSRIGYEISGIIDAVGPGVTAFKAGDKVSTVPGYSQSRYGAYGESALAPLDSVVRYPDNLSPTQAAAIWMQYLTAWGGLIYRGKLKAGQAVLIPAASSSVGLAAIELTKLAGATAIACTRTSGKKQALLDFGADAVIVSQEENLPEAVTKITSGRGANLIFDPVGGKFVETLAQAAAREALILEYGSLSGEPTPFPLLAAFQKAFNMSAYTLMEVKAQPELYKTGVEYVYEHLKSGKLKPVIDHKSFSLGQIADAHRYMESNQQFGKIVVTV